MLKAGDEPIPGYRLEKFLGKGQFGQVWRSTTPGQARAALKFLDLGGKQGWKEFRGIQRVKAIRHPHLMPITALWLLDEDWHIIDDSQIDQLRSEPEPSASETLLPQDTTEETCEPRWLVVAQLLGDKTLSERLEECQKTGKDGIPPHELLRYMEEAAKGIDFLNSAGHDLGDGRRAVQHCDIKPANILVVGDSVLICDFGVAQVLADSGVAMTATGMVGSPAYMAPECVNRKPSDHSDQYSLAVTYVELRTGKLPFRSESYYDVMEAHRQGKLDLSKLSAAEARVIRKATSVNPKERYASCQEMVLDLQHAIEGKTGKRAFSRGQLALLLGTVAVAVTAGSMLIATIINGGDDGSGPQLRTLAVRVFPPDAQISVDNEPFTTGPEGLLELKRKVGDRVRIRASKEPEYEEQRADIYVRDYLDRPFEIRLEFNAAYLAERGLSQLETDFTQAMNDFAQAIRRDAAYATLPAATYLLPKDESRPVRRIAIDTQGRWFVCGADDGIIRAWHFAGPDPPGTPRDLIQHDASIQSLVVSPQWVAAASDDGQVSVSQPKPDGSSTAIDRWQLTQNIITLAIDPGQRWLLTGSDNGDGLYLLQRWDLQASRISRSLVKLGQHNELISQILISKDGEAVVTGSWDDTVMQWPLANPGRGRLLGRLDGDVYCLARTSLGIAFAGDGGLVSDQPSDVSQRRHRVAWSPESAGAAVEFPEGHADIIEVLATSSNGEWLSAGSVDSTIHVWDMSSGQPRGPTVLAGGHPTNVSALAFDSAGEWLVSGGEGGRVVLWDVSHASERGPFILGRHAGRVSQIIVTPDDRSLISSGVDGSVRRWDLPRCRLIKRACDEAGVRPRPSADGDESQLET